VNIYLEKLQERVLGVPSLVCDISTLVYIIFRISEVFCNWFLSLFCLKFVVGVICVKFTFNLLFL